MKVKNLKLKDYRNYSNLYLEFSDGVNVFIGDNAQGKTNILESIYYCSISKSHRTSKDKEIIRFGTEKAEISLYIEKERINKRVDITILKDGKKTIDVNSIKIKKVSDLFGTLNSVMFSPEDLKIVKESPEQRRKFLDIELCKMSKKYYYNIVQYNKVLNQRNALLKSNYMNYDILDVYDIELSKFGAEVVKYRLDYLERINKYGKQVHSDITYGKEQIEFIYSSNIKDFASIKENIYNLLIQKRNDDSNRKYTTVGPHRDDFLVKINGNDVKNFGSQGQQRTAVLTIKFASMEVIKEITGEYPVLLLDDVLSELDQKRQSYILNSVSNIQTIITCTGVENINRNIRENSKIFMVKNGMVEENPSIEDGKS